MMSDTQRPAVVFLVMTLSLFCLRPPAVLSGGTIARDPGPPAKHAADVKIPRDYKTPEPATMRHRGAEITVDLWASGFAQGMAVYAEIYRNDAERKTSWELKQLTFDGREIAASERSWGYRALFGIHPETRAGNKILRLVYVADGRERVENITLIISASAFQFSRRPLDLGKFSDVAYRPTPEEIAFIERCREKKKEAFARSGPDLLGEAVSHPRDRHFITSPFWAKRLVMQYRIKNGKKIYLKNRLNVHRGVDLRGSTGDPVYALADGEVVIAEPMYYEGNLVVVDHGNRNFSVYMHLDRLKVKEGASVRAGDRIGSVGSTGQSTAAHLHVSLILNGVSVDPLSLLVLPLRK